MISSDHTFGEHLICTAESLESGSRVVQVRSGSWYASESIASARAEGLQHQELCAWEMPIML